MARPRVTPKAFRNTLKRKSAAVSLKKDPRENGALPRRWKPGELQNGSELSQRGNKIDPARFVQVVSAMEKSLWDCRKLHEIVAGWPEKWPAFDHFYPADASPAAPRTCVVVPSDELSGAIELLHGMAERLRHGMKSR